MDDAAALAIRFTERINSRDLEGVARTMSADHTFVDTASTAIIGKAACVKAWRKYCEAFAGYRNVLEGVPPTRTKSPSSAALCPGHPELDGPALWTAMVAADKVSEWRAALSDVQGNYLITDSTMSRSPARNGVVPANNATLYPTISQEQRKCGSVHRSGRPSAGRGRWTLGRDRPGR